MKLLHHHSDLGCWEMALAPPAPALRGLVDTYSGYDERNTRFTRRHELPGIQAVLIVNLGAPITIIDTDGHTLPVASGAGFAAGLSDAYAVSDSTGSQRGFQVMFTPQGARRFFGLPMRALTNRAFDLADLLGPVVARDLIEGLQAVNSWDAGFRLLDAMLQQRMAIAPGFDIAGAREASWTLRQLQQSHGRMTVAALATELGCSRKLLAARFREHVGLTPKSVSRILRFRHALTLIDAKPARWSAIAQDAGYFDQAHFANDFRQLTGRTPGDYLADRLPDQYGLPVG
ncbi:helix-turn-helix transcriptional regulator [Ferrovibrio terrae]|uniref:helix-turn-helix domain-containing protein n=1 Tax=Ferrovibrio terrae TaxID=2594003 RepID=UPI00313819C0